MARQVVVIKGLPALKRKLGVARFQAAGKAALLAGATHLKGKIAKYPPQRRGRKQPFKSDASRRYFFAALKSGEIDVPYQRTTKLAQSWAVSQPKWHTAEVGTNASYAKYVQGRDHQSKFHSEGGWHTAEDTLDKERRNIERTVQKAITAWLNMP